MLKHVFIFLFTASAIFAQNKEFALTIDAFGGIDNYQDPSKIADTDFIDARNILTDTNKIVKRNGNVLVTTFNTPVSYIKEFITSSNEKLAILQAGTTVYATNFSTSPIFITSITAQTDIESISAFNKHYIVNGVDTSIAFDGTTVSTTPVPICKYITFAYERLICANAPGAESTIYFSEYANPNNWDIPLDRDIASQDPTQITFDKQDGKAITGIFASKFGLLVFKKTKTGLIRGNSATTFTKSTLSDTIGCVDNRYVHSISNGCVRWLANEGLYEWCGGADGPQKISEEIQTTIDTINQIKSNKGLIKIDTKNDWDTGSSSVNGEKYTFDTTEAGNLKNTISSMVYTADTMYNTGIFLRTTSTLQGVMLTHNNTTYINSFSDGDYTQNLAWTPHDVTTGCTFISNGYAQYYLYAENVRCDGALRTNFSAQAPYGTFIFSITNNTYNNIVGPYANMKYYIFLNADTLAEATKYVSITFTFSPLTSSTCLLTTTVYEKTDDPSQIIRSTATYTVPLQTLSQTPILKIVFSRTSENMATYTILNTRTTPWETIGSSTFTCTFNDTTKAIDIYSYSNLTHSSNYVVDNNAFGAEQFNFLAYYTSGTYISNAFDTAFSTINFINFMPQLNTITSSDTVNFYIASATNTDISLFNSWTEISSNTTNAVLKRYIRLKAEFNSPTFFPVNKKILEQMYISVRTTGTYISTPLYIGNNITGWGQFLVTGENLQNALFYIRSASYALTSNDITPWELVTNYNIPNISTNAYAQIRIISTDTVNIYNITLNWNEGEVSRGASLYLEGRSYWSVNTSSSTIENNLILVLQKNGKWTFFDGPYIKAFNLFDYIPYGSDALNGNIYKLWQPNTINDINTAIKAYVKTKYFTLDAPNNNKIFRNFYLESFDINRSTVTIGYSKDKNLLYNSIMQYIPENVIFADEIKTIFPGFVKARYLSFIFKNENVNEPLTINSYSVIGEVEKVYRR